MLWCAVNNLNQPYDEELDDSRYKFRKNKTVDELLDSMPQRGLNAINEFLERHPISATCHNYQGVGVCEINKHVQSTPFYGPFMDDYCSGRVCQIGENREVGWSLGWSRNFWISLQFYPSAYHLIVYQNLNIIKLKGTQSSITYSINYDGSLGKKCKQKTHPHNLIYYQM